MKKVSVMMPVYNAEKFVSEALESVLSQDYPNLEVIVSDDASTDLTVEIVNDYSRRFPGKLVILTNKINLGVTANCNHALSYCNGDYVSLFAGDDIMLPGKISKQVAALDACPTAVLCYHPVEMFESSTGEILTVTNKNAREDVHSFKDMLLKLGIPGGCSIMVRKVAIPSGGYDSRLKTVSDWLFFLEISLKGDIIKVDELLARYRRHSSGTSHISLPLLRESLSALDLLVEKSYPLVIDESLLSRARARFIAGEVVRQLTKDKATAYRLSLEVLLHSSAVKYRVLCRLAWLNAYVPGISFISSLCVERIKYFMKKYLS